jgi:hypothetical protein
MPGRFSDRAYADVTCAACPSNANCLNSQAVADDNFYMDGSGKALACPRDLCISALGNEARSACKDRIADVNTTLVSCCANGRRLPAESNPLCGACDARLTEVPVRDRA